jgi:acetoacetyl-CoA reductase
MNGRTALVTGGMGGIGTAICQHLASEGANVIASFHRNGDSEIANRWREEQLSKGFDIEVFYADVSNFSSCENLVKEINAKFHNIDILVNNAGITRDALLSKMDLEQWQVVLRTNLDSIFHVTRQVINGMIDRRYGRIINISSINGQKGQFGQCNYASSKAGIHGFTKALALEVAGSGVTVNTISPGYIATPMVMKLNEALRDKIIAQIPVGRLGRPDEIARAVGFLAAECSGFITGTNLSINGGQYLV